MKWLTPEFWLMLLANVFGVCSALGLLTPDQASDLTKAGGAIAGAVIAALTSLGYLQNRATVKAAAAAVAGQVIAAQGVQPMTQSVGDRTQTNSATAQRVRAVLTDLGLD